MCKDPLIRDWIIENGIIEEDEEKELDKSLPSCSIRVCTKHKYAYKRGEVNMTDFLQDTEDRFGQAKKDYKKMTEQTTQPEPEITEAEVELMECNTALSKVLLYLQDHTLSAKDSKDLLSQINSFDKDLQKLRVRIGRGVDELCEQCNGEGCEVVDVEPDPDTGAMVGSIGECSKCNGTGKKL